MNERVMKKWTKALRSGKYKQGYAALCVEDSKGNKSFCCLGVLCDLYNKEMKKNKKKTLDIEKNKLDQTVLEYNPKAKSMYSFNNNGTELPEEVVEWAGFCPENTEGSFASYEHIPLVAMNDGIRGESRPKTFKQIAAVIEQDHDLL